MYPDLSQVEKPNYSLMLMKIKVDVSLKIEVALLVGEKSTGLKQVENLATSIILALRR